MVSEYGLESVDELLDKLDKNKFLNSEKKIEFGKFLYSLCKEKNHEMGMAFVLLKIGETYANISKYEEALPFLLDSINLSQKLNICDLQVSGHIIIGNVFYDIGEYEKSMDYYNTAEELAKIIINSKNYFKNSSYELCAARTLNNIGEVCKVLNSYEDALIYYNKSVSYDEKLNFQGTFGVSLSNIGDIMYRLGKYDEALEYINKSLKYQSFHNYKMSLSESYRILALIYEKKGNIDECQEYYSKAINMANKTGYIYNKIEALIDYSNFLINTGNYEAAEGKLEEAYNISIYNKIFTKTLDICKIFIRIYEHTKNDNQAYKFYKLYFEYERKLEYLEAEKRANNLKIKMKLEQMEKENKNILAKSEVFRRKSEELIETVRNISIISELGQKITSTADLNEVFEMLYNSIQTFMPTSGFAVGLYNDGDRILKYHYCMENNKNTVLLDTNIDSKTSIASRCLRERKFIVINDMSNEYLKYVENVNYIVCNKNKSVINSAIYWPLIIDNNLIGIITVQAYEKNAFTNLHIEMIKALTAYAAIAINNAIKSMNLQEEVEQRRKVQIKLEEINNKLLYLSENDGLTSIANRRKFDDVINVEWNKAEKSRTKISIIIFDIDCFKQYNDNYGHIEGDYCLVNICKLLTSSPMNNYFADRYGGDEFIIIFPNTNLEDAISFGENFRKKVENLKIPHKFSNVNDIVTISMGGSAVIPSSKISINEFIRQADNALYSAKKNGRNQIKKYENKIKSLPDDFIYSS
jgi:diguanylate cyclase (GGDEF)-like protein